MFAKEYDLPLARDYVRHWGMREAVRELIQNALDSNSPFEWEFSDGVLSITSRFATLAPSTLLLGVTSKADNDDAIGSFGEGYKIAMLVLTRMGYTVVVHNGAVTWTPAFKLSKKFGVDTLHVIEASTAKREGVTFEVGGLTEEDIADVKELCLHMQPQIGEVKKTIYGRILLERPGQLYVGGLFICDTDMHYGYDIDPQHIALERDRQTVNGFDLCEIAQKMWIGTGDLEHVAMMIEADLPDMRYVEFDAPEVVKQACYDWFRSKHPGAIAVDNQKDLERLVEKGMTNTVILGGGFHKLVTASENYPTELRTHTAPITVQDRLRTWLAANRKHMRRQGIVAFKKLITQSKDWRN